MALTDFGALSGARKKLWSTDTWRLGLDEAFFASTGMMGTGKNKPVQTITELTETEKGDKCVIQLVAELAGDGVVDDNLLDGSEEQLTNDIQEIQLSLLRNGIKNKGKMSEQRTVLKFRTEAKEKLSFWLGDKLDEIAFLTITGRAYTMTLSYVSRSGSSQMPTLGFAGDVTAPSSARRMFAGVATSEATLQASETMSWNFLLKVAAFAKRKRLRPIRAEGRGYYCVLMSTEQAKDLKADSTYQANVGRAESRGGANPLFKGNFANVDGLILFEHPKVFNTLGGTSGVNGVGGRFGSSNTVNGADALLLGAQALGFARIGSAEWEESDNTDYKNRIGIGYGRMIGYKKPKFVNRYDSGTSQDFGVVVVTTAAEAIA